jgi:hypothetical protein
VKDDNYPFLAYSPKISIQNSSEPFRAFLGAIFSVVEGVSVDPSEFNPDMALDTIIEEEDEEDVCMEDDKNDGSGMEDDDSKYVPSSSEGTDTDQLSSHDGGLMVCSWLPIAVDQLTHLLSDYFVFPQVTRILSGLDSSPSFF